MHASSLAYKPLPPTCFITVLRRAAIKQKRKFCFIAVLLHLKIKEFTIKQKQKFVLFCFYFSFIAAAALRAA